VSVVRRASVVVCIVTMSLTPACGGGTGLPGGDGGGVDEGGSDAGSDADAGRLCTPGASVFCRCADRTEATKLCNPDGMSFGNCSPCP
jgi:hypothetical protein